MTTIPTANHQPNSDAFRSLRRDVWDTVTILADPRGRGAEVWRLLIRPQDIAGDSRSDENLRRALDELQDHLVETALRVAVVENLVARRRRSKSSTR